jgi:hypothetical protein
MAPLTMQELLFTWKVLLFYAFLMLFAEGGRLFISGQHMRSLTPLIQDAPDAPDFTLNQIFSESRVLDVETSNCAMHVLVLTEDGLYNPANISLSDTNR